MDVFGKCLSAAGSPEYLDFREKQQAVPHSRQTWAPGQHCQGLSQEKSLCFCVPLKAVGAAAALATSAGQVHCVTRDKDLQM